MIRILEVQSELNWGGVEVWLANLLAGLPRGEFAVDLLASHVEPGFRRRIEDCGGRVVASPPASHMPAYLARLREVLRGAEYDIVHCHMVDHMGLVMWTAARAGVAGRMAHCHIDLAPVVAKLDPARRSYLRFNRWLVNRYATAGVAASAAAARTLYGVDWMSDGRYEVLHCGVDLAAFRQPAAGVREELGIPENAFVIGHVGRFEAQKNHEFLARVAPAVLRLRPEARFVLVGAGPLEGEFRASLERSGVAQAVAILEPRPDIARLMLGAMDAFVFPSRFEGLGLALVEAQAAGLQCVISDRVPVEADVVPGLIERLAIEAGPEAWARALASCRRPDAAGRAVALRMVEASPFSLQFSRRRMKEKYQELCGQPVCV